MASIPVGRLPTQKGSRMTEIYVTTMHGDSKGAADARKRGAALLIWDDTGTEDGYVLRTPDGADHWIVATAAPEAYDEARAIIG